MQNKIIISLIILLLIFSLRISALDIQNLKEIKYKIIDCYQHDPEAFTQGLEIHNSYLFEGTGLYGNSSLKKIELENTRVINEIKLENKYFGEGITILNNKIYQLSWKENTAFVYDLNFNLLKKLSYPGEGWGLSNDGSSLIMSDGSEYLYFRDPETFKLLKKIKVKAANKKIKNINELEYLAGYLYANIWQENYIVKINIKNGEVKSYLNLTRVLNLMPKNKIDVLNGIAYQAADNSFLVTGKFWPKIFKLKLMEINN